MQQLRYDAYTNFGAVPRSLLVHMLSGALIAT
jgi:hypothetical protein